MNRFFEWLHGRRAPFWAAGAMAFLVVYSAVTLQTGPRAELRALPGGTPSLEECPAYSVTEAHTYVSALGPAGREVYRRALVLDLAYPLVFAPALLLCIAVLFSRLLRSERLTWALALLPALAAPLDWLEDALLLALLNSSPPYPAAIAGVASVATSAKLALVVLSSLLILAGLVGLAVRRNPPRTS